MRRVFGAVLTVLVLIGVPSAVTVAQTTTQQVQQKAAVAGKEATKAVDSAGTETQAAVAHPDEHKKTILIAIVALLVIVLVLAAILRRGRRKQTIIRTRR